MKKLLLSLAGFLALSCTQQLKVELTNTTSTERDDETVEIAWSELTALKGVTADNIVVRDNEGEEIPSQVISEGHSEPLKLIFQADVDEMQSVVYTIEVGTPCKYKSKAYGRFVPERLDDYAWENDKVAFRAYGPALETAPGQMLSTPGFDAWVKRTEELVINSRYERGDYHHDHGDGMDCYKVGPTLGAGASAPIVDGKLIMSGNFATWETLANGPIRTQVALTYKPFEVNGKEVSMIKVISLDAGSHFNHVVNIYAGDFESLPVANGFVRHTVKAEASGEGWLAFVEEASDSKNPAEDGDIYAAVVQPGATVMDNVENHAVMVADAKMLSEQHYWAGTGWSKGGIDDMEDWLEEVKAQVAMVTTPLAVKIIK